MNHQKEASEGGDCASQLRTKRKKVDRKANKTEMIKKMPDDLSKGNLRNKEARQKGKMEKRAEKKGEIGRPREQNRCRLKTTLVTTQRKINICGTPG